MIRSFEVFLHLHGTDPAGPVLATVPITSGTLSMDKSWAPAVRAQFIVPYEAFTIASWQLIEPTLSAKFCSLFIVPDGAGTQGLWELNIRDYQFNVKAGTVELVASSYEALVQDYGRATGAINYTDTAVYGSTLSIVQNLCQRGAGSDVAPLSAWTAPAVGSPGSSNEFRFVVPGTELWSHAQALAAWTPGGIVQHYGYGNSDGDGMDWLLTNPTYSITPTFDYEVPVEPGPDLGIGGDAAAELVEWTAARSREAEAFGNAVYLDFPARQATGSVTFTTSGYVMDYSYNLRGTAGSTAAKRRQAQATIVARSTPDTTGRDLMASQRLTRIARRAVGQTYTQPLDTRLLPWQRHQDSNAVAYGIENVMHNLGDGTSVVTINRL